jgi:hypothetical protein
MDDDLERVTEWLLDASAKVPADYFQLPVAGLECPAYRERVYCYELYHQWRAFFDNSRFSLAGEVDKLNHPLVRSKAKPDFLVHVPGGTENLLVLEVKPAHAALGRIVKDLKTLTHFRTGLAESCNYRGAYLWLYGVSGAKWADLRRQLLESARSAGGAIDTRVVDVVLHEQAGKRARKVRWE